MPVYDEKSVSDSDLDWPHTVSHKKMAEESFVVIFFPFGEHKYNDLI